MRANAVSAVIFSNSNDIALKELTENRSMSSLPFGGRYRLIDFALSNLSNAGISDIGIITKENYRSLMDHVGSGLYWDLDRKRGGLRIIPPFITGESQLNGFADISKRAAEFVSRLNSEYVIVCESGTVANFDIGAFIAYHIEKDADITLFYRKAECADKFKNTIKFDIKNGKIVGAVKANRSSESGNYSLGTAIFKKSVFLNFAEFSKSKKSEDAFLTLISENKNNYRIYGFEHKGFAAVIDSRKSFFESNMKLFSEDVRKDLFNKERPVFTKTRDDMPTRYGIFSDVKESLVADGCIIEGTVKNSVLFRGVRVHKGAKVENSILMQGVEVGENAVVRYVVADKNSVITANTPIKGTKHKAFIVKKNQVL
ncbi:MAG: glucose-1-phosphate adenylyltransferase subunit GlgD [Clostridia bacterium]|nr:glucose-1-phosphate adenylyltransferase subunit GlgD [Clostridia bacterium]